LGTPTALINKDGEVDWSVELDAWGSVIKEHNPKNLEQPIRFQGQHFDEESGLHYNRHRYYDPKLGRYITQDPIGLRGGLNLHAYVKNPTGWIDPIGLNEVITIVINNNDIITGTHVGVHVSGKTPILYDPGGSYVPPSGPRGTADILEGGDADLHRYVEQQIKDDGPDVETFAFDVSDEDAEKIRKKMYENDSCAPLRCASCSSDALNGIGPFKDLGHYSLPSRLAKKLGELKSQSAPSLSK
jgi:RHS repeat-associated protein